jgi:hypothetical protein
MVRKRRALRPVQPSPLAPSNTASLNSDKPVLIDWAALPSARGQVRSAKAGFGGDVAPFTLRSRPKMIDGRGTLHTSRWREAGWTFRALGRP